MILSYLDLNYEPQAWLPDIGSPWPVITERHCRLTMHPGLTPRYLTARTPCASSAPSRAMGYASLNVECGCIWPRGIWVRIIWCGDVWRMGKGSHS